MCFTRVEGRVFSSFVFLSWVFSFDYFIIVLLRNVFPKSKLICLNFAVEKLRCILKELHSQFRERLLIGNTDTMIVLNCCFVLLQNMCPLFSMKKNKRCIFFLNRPTYDCLLFSLLMTIFNEQKMLVLMQIDVSVYKNLIFMSHFKTFFHSLSNEDSLPYYILEILFCFFVFCFALSFTFRFIIQLKFIFMCTMKQMSGLIFFSMDM